MSGALTASDLIGEIRLLANMLMRNRDALCRLDGLIGDGDHGIAMAEGFEAAAKAAEALDAGSATFADILNACAKAFLNAVGASSGPLYATALIRAGKAAGPRASLPLLETPKLIVAMAEGIKARGQATIGDKTMLDAWGKAAEVAARGLASGDPVKTTLSRIRAAAHEGAESTKTMTANRGRAARLGERTLGHMDPGAASAALIVETLVDAWLAHQAESDGSDATGATTT